MMPGTIVLLVTLGVAAAAGLFVWLGRQLEALARAQSSAPDGLARLLDQRHRAMLVDLGAGLAGQGERLHAALGGASDRLRDAVSRELGETRERMATLQAAQTESLAQTRELVVEKIHQILGEQVGRLTSLTDARLGEISGKVSERLDEGFRRTNETFAQVMARLATIDEAQKKIDGLTSNVVSLQELLGDKRARGAFGEVQLEALVANLLPATAYRTQHTLSNGTRVDCALFLPPPTGTVAIDAKFPLENFQRMCDRSASDLERAQAARLFKIDVRRHIDAIAEKYILPGETSDGAILFVPAEAVFAEIHGAHPELVEHAQRQRVWIASPTTMMAILNTARAVLKDTEMRKQVHVIQESLGKLAKEFERFDERMKKLASHIQQAHKDAEEVCTTSRKISSRFAQIERVELEGGEPAETPRLLTADES